MNNKNHWLALGVVCLVLVAGIALAQWIWRGKQTEKIERLTDVVIASEGRAGAAKQGYLATVEQNIQREKGAAENAVIQGDKVYSDGDSVRAAFAELITRARKHNDAIRNAVNND